MRPNRTLSCDVDKRRRVNPSLLLELRWYLIIRSSMATPRKIGAVLPQELVGALRAAVAREGDRAIARKLGIARPTILRALAGLRIMPGNIALIRERLTEARAS